jgi:D-xylose transport system permease protein
MVKNIKPTDNSVMSQSPNDNMATLVQKQSGISKMITLFKKNNLGSYGVIAATIIIWLFFNFTTQGLFLSPRNLTMMLIQGVVLGIVVTGVLLIMVTGNIDISIASTVGLCATIAAWLQAIHGWQTLPTLIVVGIVGLVIGLLQGTWVAYIGVPAFIVTLAGQTIFRGASYLLNHGQTYSPMTESFKYIAGGYVSPTLSTILLFGISVLVFAFLFRRFHNNEGHTNYKDILKKIIPVFIVLGLVGYVSFSYKGIPIPVLLLAGLTLIVTFISTRTRFGRHLYAIGGNREAAVLAGINVKLHTLLVFAGMGVLYAFSGVVLASRVNGAPPDPALFIEMDAITACVIGGTSMFGGIGTVPGAILGTLLLISLNNGMDLMGISTFIQYVVKGVVLLLAVLLDISLKKRRS